MRAFLTDYSEVSKEQALSALIRRTRCPCPFFMQWRLVVSRPLVIEWRAGDTEDSLFDRYKSEKDIKSSHPLACTWRCYDRALA